VGQSGLVPKDFLFLKNILVFINKKKKGTSKKYEEIYLKLFIVELCKLRFFGNLYPALPSNFFSYPAVPCPGDYLATCNLPCPALI
jgi:hypothetical protein